MALFQGLLLLIFGIGILLIVYQSLSKGALPFGVNGFAGRLEFQKDKQPTLFWLAFIFYSIAGLTLTIIALRIIFGFSAPLPLK